MPKTIVLLLDGTSNEIASKRSNILRLYGCLSKTDSQLVYYDPGVGTFGAEAAWSQIARKAVEVWGMATGWGLDHNVKEAYRFLVDNYDDGRRTGTAPDRIVIYGFSRGAYTARVLAGFLHAFGMMEPRSLNLLDYVYRGYKRIGTDGGGDKELSLHYRILQPRPVTVDLLGLFDTVASVIESGRFGPRLRNHAFTRENPSVRAVRHAVAIDERRTMFRPQLWPEGGAFVPDGTRPDTAQPQDVREVWFSGVHGDVGGGYPEPESALAKLPLDWMIRQSAAQGVAFDADTVRLLVLGQPRGSVYAAPDPLGPLHNSMSAGWAALEVLPRRKPALSQRPAVLGFVLPLMERRTIPEGARVHHSVTERIAGGQPRPRNLPENHVIEDAPETRGVWA